MKRLFLIIVIAALAAPFLYQHGEEYITDLNRTINDWLVDSSMEEGSPVAKVTESEAFSNPVHEAEASAAIKASLSHLKKSVPTKQKRKAIRKTKRAKKKKIGKKAPVAPTKIKVVKKSKSVPVAKLSNRWIKNKSGSSAMRFGMEKSRKDNRCADGGCEKHKVGDSVSLVGVVVDTDISRKKQKISDVAGEVKKGHYSENTPGVYIK